MNYHQKDPQKKPPPGWKVNNVLYQRLRTQAQRTGCPSLIAQVQKLSGASRSELARVIEPVADAVKGLRDPATLNLQEFLQPILSKQGTSHAE